MKRLFFIVLTFITQVFAQPETLNLMPVPQKLYVNGTAFKLTEKFTTGVINNKSLKLIKGLNRFLTRLSGRTGFFLEHPFVKTGAAPDSVDFYIRYAKVTNPKLYVDESYKLSIDSNKIILDAKTDIGALRGIETLLQLLDADSTGYFFTGVEITDKPRFPWRGLMIDVCRHFMPLDVILRNIDAMAAVKLNVLHLHLSEDQGFRIECKTFPKLHQLGSDGFYFTQEDIKKIINYASERGIRVVPEFDIPGHATSWLVAYPEFASMSGPYKLQRDWGIFDPVFDPTNEKTYEFFDAFFAEMTKLFPDEYFHIGGDENNGKQWSLNPEIRKFMQENKIENTEELQAYFNSKIVKILNKYGKKMVGWDEILHPGIPKNIVIQSWRGKEGLINAAKNGYNVILSNGYYIDLIQPASFHYLNDPIPADIDLSDDEKKLILGGEATMWSEFVSPETIDSRIWPRTAAIAERLWSPRIINDVDDMYRRLETVGFRLEELGITHIKNYGMMLRRLTNNRDILPLKTLVDVLEPVKFYNRNKLRKQTQQSPLTRVVDAARPDAAAARNFRRMITTYLNTDDELIETKIKNQLKLWVKNHKAVVKLAATSPVLSEILPQSENLKNVAGIGLTALRYLDKKVLPDKEWLRKAETVLTGARKPVAQTELMIIDGIGNLIQKLSNQGN